MRPFAGKDRHYWQRVEEIFAAVIESLPEDRATCLQTLCRGDHDLRMHIQRLLEHDGCTEPGFLEPDHALAIPESTSPEAVGDSVTKLVQPGSEIGPYTLHEKIGEGGFGVVYSAMQKRPVRRRVALKILKPGMDTRQVVARFQAERQALALMDHPHIARVLDGGETDSGRPYFVMEFVKGIPITNYCDRCNWTTRQRLELFILVCQAVQHAHQKGIIHRDLKPSNVLVACEDEQVPSGHAEEVTDREFGPGVPCSLPGVQGSIPSSASPKIIDFGVAKAINQRLTEETLHTQFAQLVGTPLYMSPEQAEMCPLEVDTRSDIYSLGVLLYELLTGATPFDGERLQRASFDELRRIIRQEEPPRPSTRIRTMRSVRESGTADELSSWSGAGGQHGPGATGLDSVNAVRSRRRMAPRPHVRVLSRDLDWIVMKALEKDRTRRYQTAADLAQDLERYLRHDPVEARPPSIGYRLRKFARRHVALSAGLGIAIAGMLAGGIAAVWQARTATVERDRAEAALAESQAVTEFVRSILVQADPKAYGQDHSIRDALNRAGPRIEIEFAKAPRIRAAIHEAVADAYWGVGDLTNAKVHFRLALASHNSADPPDELARHVTAIQLVRLFLYAGDLAEAEAFLAELERAQAEVPRQNPSVAADLLSMQGELARIQRDYSRAIALFEKARELRENVPGDQRVNLARYSMELAHTASVGGSDRDGPVELARDAVSVFRQVLGAESEITVWGMRDLAYYLAARGRNEDLVQAEGLLRDALHEQSRISGATSLGVAIMTSELGSVLASQGRLEEAHENLLRALELKRTLLGDDHLEVAQTAFNLGKFLARTGSYAQAILFLEDSVRIRRQKLAPLHPDLAVSLRVLAHVTFAVGDAATAESLYRESLDSSSQLLGDRHPELVQVLVDIAATLVAQRSFADAEELLRTALSTYGLCPPDMRPPARVLHDAKGLLGATLAGLGEEFAQLGDSNAIEFFAQAEELLLDSYTATKDDPFGPERTQSIGMDSREQAFDRIVSLYEAWHTVQPGAGYDSKAAEWQATLDEYRESTRPIDP